MQPITNAKNRQKETADGKTARATLANAEAFKRRVSSPVRKETVSKEDAPECDKENPPKRRHVDPF